MGFTYTVEKEELLQQRDKLLSLVVRCTQCLKRSTCDTFGEAKTRFQQVLSELDNLEDMPID